MLGVGVSVSISTIAGIAAGVAFAITPTGLVAGVAEIGSEAGIGYTINPDNGTETVKWSNSGNPADAATYGTGAAPTSLAAGNGGTLYLHVTDGGETVTRSYPIRYPAPVAAGALVDQSFVESTGDQTYDVSVDFTFDGTPVFSLTTAPAGVTINSGTGVVTHNTGTLPVQAGTSIVVRAADAVDATRFASSAYSLDITAAPAAPTISVDSITVLPGADLVQLTTDMENDGIWVWAIVLQGATAPVPDGAGGWTGTVLNFGSFPVGLNGAQSTIPEDGATGVQHDLYVYQRTTGNVDSNPDFITYTADNPQLEVDFTSLANGALVAQQGSLPSGATYIEDDDDGFGGESFIFAGVLQASIANRTAYTRRTDFSPQTFRRTTTWKMNTNVGGRKAGSVTFNHVDAQNKCRLNYNAGNTEFRLTTYVAGASSNVLTLPDTFPNGEERTVIITQTRTTPGGTPTHTIQVTVDGVAMTDDGTPTGNDTFVTTDLVTGDHGYRNFAGIDPVVEVEGWGVTKDQIEDLA